MNDLEAVRVTEARAVIEACGRPLAVIYKHSPSCGMSRRAAREVQRFVEATPDVPVYVVDVVRDRDLSVDIATRLGVRHASPQVILVVAGAAVWDASHGGITADALTRAADARRDH